jgi:hypothetical protein
MADRRRARTGERGYRFVVVQAEVVVAFAPRQASSQNRAVSRTQFMMCPEGHAYVRESAGSPRWFGQCDDHDDDACHLLTVSEAQWMSR